MRARLAVILTLVAGGALLAGCALFQRPRLECRLCYREAPCPPEWIAVAEEDGGGCVLVVAAGLDCPKED